MPPPSPDERRDGNGGAHVTEYFTENGIIPEADGASVQSNLSATQQQGAIEEAQPNAKTKLLGEAQKYNISTHHTHCGEENCSHGTISPRPRYARGYGSFATQSEFSQDGYGGRYSGGIGDGVGHSGDNAHGVLGDAVTDGLMGVRQGNKMSTTQWLAKRHGVKGSRIMYVGRLPSPSLSPVLLCCLCISLTSKVGTCCTIFLQRIGSDSIAGHSCKAT